MHIEYVHYTTLAAPCLTPAQPFIVDAALNYLAVSAAQRMGFLELRRYLQAFVDNEDKVRPLPLPAAAAALNLMVCSRSCGRCACAPSAAWWTLGAQAATARTKSASRA
jgi:hypothetical protein